jgi:hypothetical protein
MRLAENKTMIKEKEREVSSLRLARGYFVSVVEDCNTEGVDKD